jgi:hypothetical protein
MKKVQAYRKLIMNQLDWALDATPPTWKTSILVA